VETRGVKETEREDRRPQAEGDRDGGKEMQETACFLKVFVHSRRLGVVFDSFDSLHHQLMPRHSPCQ
jgi:hypothetical protein